MFNENERAVLGQMDENGFIQMELRFRWVPEHDVEIKKCGFRLVYEQDIEDIREMISAQSTISPVSLFTRMFTIIQQKESN